MSTSDWIAVCAFAVAAASVAISLYSLRESRRANHLALLDRRSVIYGAFKRLATEALCEGERLKVEELQAFEPHADAAELHLPTDLATEISEFYRDCETIAWARGLTQPADEEYVLKGRRQPRAFIETL